MASLEAGNRGGLAFRVCLRMNTNSHHPLNGVKGSSDMIEKPGGSGTFSVCVFVCVCVRVREREGECVSL